MQTKQLTFGDGPLDTMKVWAPDSLKEMRGTLFIVHGLTESIERYKDLARYMTAHGWTIAGFNVPGHGDSFLTVDGIPRPAYCGGEGSWQTVVDMLDRALHRVKSEIPEHPVVLLGFSLGSFLARAWLVQQQGPLPIDRLFLLGTGEQPTWILQMVRGIIRRECRHHGEYNSTPLVQNIAFGSYNRRIKHASSPYAWLLTDPAALAAYEQDKNVCKTITGGLFRELLSCMIYVNTHETTHPCVVPTVFLSGREDPVGENGKGVRRAAAKFPGASVLLVPGRHDILHDAGCEAVFKLILKHLS
mgnify:CR=1 FL=1